MIHQTYPERLLFIRIILPHGVSSTEPATEEAVLKMTLSLPAPNMMPVIWYRRLEEDCEFGEGAWRVKRKRPKPKRPGFAKTFLDILRSLWKHSRTHEQTHNRV
jgi:transposase